MSSQIHKHENRILDIREVVCGLSEWRDGHCGRGRRHVDLRLGLRFLLIIKVAETAKRRRLSFSHERGNSKAGAVSIDRAWRRFR